MTAANEVVDAKRAKEIEAEFESERAFRPIDPRLQQVLYVGLILFAIYHYVTAGFGIPIDYWHMGFHLSGVLIALFPTSRVDVWMARSVWCSDP